MCIAIAIEIVNCNFIRTFHKVCFTNYDFKNSNNFSICSLCYVLSPSLTCSLCYVLSSLKIFSFRSDDIFHETSRDTILDYFQCVMGFASTFKNKLNMQYSSRNEQ